MSEIAPPEMWLAILKDLEPKELIQKRNINHFFKEIIDVNLRYFYRRYSYKYPHLNLSTNNSINYGDFERLNTLLYIEKLSEDNCSPYFIKKMQIERFTIHEVNLVHRLYLEHGIEYYAGIRCSKMSANKIDMMIELKEAGFPIFFANRFTNEYPITREKLDLLKRLKSLGISDFFCCKLTFTFNEDQRNRLFELKNSTNIEWYNAIYMVENNFFV